MFTLLVAILGVLAAIAVVLKVADSITVDTTTISRQTTPRPAERPPDARITTASTADTGDIQ